jgi:tetratricopeptide (TPR) repeat protein
MGNFPYAEYHVEEAMTLFRREDPTRGIALVLLGHTAVANGLWHDAFEHFDEVVRDYGRTRSAVPGRLGRAEVYSVLGDDDKSLEDYRKLHELLGESRPRRDVTSIHVAESLTDRHDAALTMEKLDAALEYVLLAETFYRDTAVPPDLFFRVASTSRQLADDRINEARRSQPDLELAQLDPDTRYRANEHYRRAADYFVRHARALAGRPGTDELWADSLWLAADSYDLGGWHSQAITHFTEYMAGRSEADPRRPDAVFRLAQAYHAELDWPLAVRFYEQVLADHPRSHVASRSHVPLARCLLELGRRPEAEQQMLQVVMGEQHLKPDAIDYRDALMELGTLYYDDAEYVKAVERLDEALRRYPQDPRMSEIRYRLADSHRRHAVTLGEQLGLPGLTPTDRDRLDSQRINHLAAAADLFGAIVEDDTSGGARLPESLVRYAYLYRGDCVRDLGNYREAVEHYDRVAGRFPQHHSSMTALIHIVNCYASLGDTDRARTAHRRALVRLHKLPEEAFDAPDALLDRGAWERWLQNMPVGDPDASVTAGANS